MKKRTKIILIMFIFCMIVAAILAVVAKVNVHSKNADIMTDRLVKSGSQNKNLV